MAGRADRGSGTRRAGWLGRPVDGHASGANRRPMISRDLFPTAHVEIALGGAVVELMNLAPRITRSRRVGVAHDGDDAGLGQASKPCVRGSRRGSEKNRTAIRAMAGSSRVVSRSLGSEADRRGTTLKRKLQCSVESGLEARRNEAHVCAPSGGRSSKALGSRAKFHRRRRHHSVGRLSATASSFRVMWNGVRSQPLVVFTSMSRVWPSGE